MSTKKNSMDNANQLKIGLLKEHDQHNIFPVGGEVVSDLKLYSRDDPMTTRVRCALIPSVSHTMTY